MGYQLTNLKRFHDGHVTIETADFFFDLDPKKDRYYQRLSGVSLVAWLYRVWNLGGVSTAVRYDGLQLTTGYRRLYELEKRVGKPLWVRYRKQEFRLTAVGEDLIRRYKGFIV